MKTMSCCVFLDPKEIEWLTYAAETSAKALVVLSGSLGNRCGKIDTVTPEMVNEAFERARIAARVLEKIVKSQNALPEAQE